MASYKKKHSILGLLPLFKVVEEYGVDPEKLLAKRGWSIDGMTGAAIIDQDFELQIVADALEQTDDPLLGLKVGAEVSFTAYGIYAMLLMTAPTLAEATKVSVQFQALSLLFSQMTLKQDGDYIEVCYFAPEAKPDLRRFIADRDMMGAFVFLQEMATEEEQRLIQMGTTRERPSEKDCRVFRKYFGKDITFGCSYSYFRIPHHMLSRRQKHGNELAHKLYKIQAFEMLNQFYPDVEDTVARIKQVISGYDSSYPSLPEMAKMFGCSERTLRRKLDEADTSYRDLLDEHKKARALDMLSAKDVSVNELSNALGYTEAASFLRAFKRWTGTTPKQYVAQNIS